MRTDLSKLPDPHNIENYTIANLSGGINYRDDPTGLLASQSPHMLNMWYRDGALRRRSGYKTVIEGAETDYEDGQVWFYERLFNGYVVMQRGTAIQYFRPDDPETVTTIPRLTVPSGVGHGCFFPFSEYLYYKAKGVYYRIAVDDETGDLYGTRYIWPNPDGGYFLGSTYVPIIAVNRRADGSGGNLYQPENRINRSKIVWFDIDDKSYNYYLPVSGCTVKRVQLGDDYVVSADGFMNGGKVGVFGFTVENGELPTDSTQHTYLKFDAPLFINNSDWTGSDWSNAESSGWNYLDNVVYSNIDAELPDVSAITNPQLILPVSAGNPPVDITDDLTQAAISMDPHYIKGQTNYFITANGEYINWFFLNDTLTDTWLCGYDFDTTEMHMRNYYLVSLRIQDWTWQTADYGGDREDQGWHYVKNIVYSTFPLYPPTGVNIAANTPQDGYPTILTYGSLLKYAKHIASQLSICDADTLLWISANDEYVVFHYPVTTMDFRITDYDADKGTFRAEGVYQVTIYKGDIDKYTTKLYTAPEENFVYYTKNIIYVGQQMTYIAHGGLKKSEGDMPAEYQPYVDAARAKAMTDYPNANLTGNYAVAVSKDGKYTSVYLETAPGMQITAFDDASSEFKATGWIHESFTDQTDSGMVDVSNIALMSNQLRVTYESETDEEKNGLKAIADCLYATSFGGSDAITAVFGNCEAQPNAIFWSGNGSYGVDPTYLPYDQYNLCGAFQDPITGFGKQQSRLIVFQEHHIGKAAYSITDEIGGRQYINLTYQTINVERGCDRPWTIALCGNNLVWSHSKYGVQYLKDASAAYENMVVTVSEYVNGNALRDGMLKTIQDSTVWQCTAVTDAERYYLFVDGSMWCWDFSLSPVSEGIRNLSWSRHETFHVQAAFENEPNGFFLMRRNGSIARFHESIQSDDGVPIHCYYRTPTMNMGGYYRKWNINKCIIGMLSKTGCRLKISFGGEGQTGNTYRAVVQDTAEDMPFPLILRPRGLHLHHWWLQIESFDDHDKDDVADETDLALLHLQVLYTAAGLTK